MSHVVGFKGTHYHPLKFQLSDLIIPPYDAIPADAVETYRNKSIYNFSHVDLARREGDDYLASKALLDEWLAKGIIEETPAPCYFLYRQNFTAFGKTHQRDTLLCAVGLEDFSKGIIRPHENTFGKYKADRLELLKNTGYNLSHIFGMVKDPEGFLATQFENWSFEAPFLQAKSDDGVVHTLWKKEVSQVPEVSAFFQHKPIYIVDGHHRYESALMYARQLGVEGQWAHSAAVTTFCIANVYDPGLIIYPTHRLLKKGALTHWDWEQVRAQFEVTPISMEATRTFVTSHQENPKFIVYRAGELFLLSPRNWAKTRSELGDSVARLGVTWSDRFFLKEFCGVTDSNRGTLIRYEKDFDFTWSLRDQADLIVFQAPPAVEDVTSVADEKKYMPQKSTFFIPKLAGGLVFRKLAFTRPST